MKIGVLTNILLIKRILTTETSIPNELQRSISFESLDGFPIQIVPEKLSKTKSLNIIDSLEKNSKETLKFLKKIYKEPGKNGKSIKAIRWIMHYFANENDRNKIKKNVLSKAIKMLNRKNSIFYNKNALKAIINDIKNKGDLLTLTQIEFDYIIQSYYHICQISKNANSYEAKMQEVLNKDGFMSLLKNRRDIKSLTLKFPDISEEDACNLIEAMKNNLKKIIIIESISSYILKILNNCKEHLKKPFALIFKNFFFDKINSKEISKLLSENNIKKISTNECDLGTLSSTSFFESLKDSTSLRTLRIKDATVSEMDVISIFKILNSEVATLKELALENLNINSDLLCRLLKDIENSKKLKIFKFRKFRLNSNILDSIIKILKGNNKINVITLTLIKLKSEQIDQIAEVLKVNENIIKFRLNSFKLTMNQVTLILNSIIENLGTNIKEIGFGVGKRFKIEGGSDKSLGEYKKAVETIIKKGIKYNLIKVKKIGELDKK